MICAVNVFNDNEGAIKLAVRKHANRSTNHIGVKHNLVRDACDAGKLRVMYVRTEDQLADLFTESLDIQKFHKHAKTDLNIVESNVGIYCDRCESFCRKDQFLRS